MVSSSSFSIMSLATLLFVTTNTMTEAFVIQNKKNIIRPADLSLQSTMWPSSEKKNHKKNHDRHVEQLEGQEEYFNFIGRNNQEEMPSNELTVIKFHAAWCKSCQKFGLRYTHEAQIYEDKEECKRNVRFGAIEHGANIKLCKQIGIKRLPTVHFYYQGQLVNGFPCGPSKFALFQETLEKYSKMSHEELVFEQEMNQGQELMSGISNTTTTTTAKKKPLTDEQLQEFHRQAASLLEKLGESEEGTSGTSTTTTSTTTTTSKKEAKKKSWWKLNP